MKIRAALHLALYAALAALVVQLAAIVLHFSLLQSASMPIALIFMAVAVSALLTAVLLATWRANRILAEPLQRLLAAMEELGKGNLEHRIRASNQNELGMLSQAVDQMAGRLQQVTASRDELARAEKQLRLAARALDNAAEGMMIVQNGRIVAVNRAFRIITGYSAGEVMGRTVHMLHSGAFDRQHLAQRRQSLNRAGIWQGEIWGRRKDGEIYPAWVSLSLVKDEDGFCYVSMFSDISAEKSEEMRLNYLAYHDVLTDLPNRILMQQRLSDMLARAQRRRGTVALVYIDLDHFKPVNDLYGHETGDVVLQEAARRLRDCVRKTDTVSRLGGDEFVVLLDELRGPEEVAWIAQNLLDAVERPFKLSGGNIASNSSETTLLLPPASVALSASLGIACYPHDGNTAEDLLRNADAAMYHAKQEGKGRYRFHSTLMDNEAQEQNFLTASLRKSVERQELALVYQPCYASSTGYLFGAEALVRWLSPEHGTMLPNRFIGLAEEIGFIEPIGEWVMQTACKQMRQWLDAGAAPQFVSVNLSAKQFDQDDLAERVSIIVRGAGIEPQRLQLEVSESIVVANPSMASARLQQLSRIGVRLALDDFGIGDLPLVHLQSFSVGFLKIDHSLVRKLPGDYEYANLVRGIIAIAESLKIGVTAEGVETEEQRRFLQNVGCQCMQGFLFSKPFSPEELSLFLSVAIPVQNMRTSEV